MATSNSDNKVVSKGNSNGSVADSTVLYTGRCANLYNDRTNEMKTFDFDNFIVKSVFFKGVLYVLYENFDEAGPDYCFCAMIGDEKVILFEGEKVNVFETENSLYISEVTRNTDKCTMRLFSVQNQKIEQISTIQGKNIVVEDSCLDVHVFCDGKVYKIDNDFVYVKDMVVPREKFFYRKGTITLCNNGKIDYVSRCGNYTVSRNHKVVNNSLLSFIEVKNISTDKTRILMGGWKIYKDILCIIEGDKINKKLFDNEFFYLLPHASQENVALSRYLTDTTHDNNLEAVISRFL